MQNHQNVLADVANTFPGKRESVGAGSCGVIGQKRKRKNLTMQESHQRARVVAEKGLNGIRIITLGVNGFMVIISEFIIPTTETIAVEIAAQ